MGMAALAMAQSIGGRVKNDYQKMPIMALRELARQQHPSHTDEAARVFVQRILEMEVERRTLYADEHLQGYGGSAIAPGGAPGSTAVAREPLAALYDRGIRYHETHEAARGWIAAARLPERQLLAVLIQSVKTDCRVPGPWAANYDQIAACLGHYAQMLGYPRVAPVVEHVFDCIGERETGSGARRHDRKPHRVPAFRNGQAIKNAAKSARAALILLAKV